MLLEWIEMLGLWNWLLVGLILIGLELLIPGVFIIWFGFGAVATALVCGVLASFLSIFGLWQMQLALFCLFSIIFVFVGRSLLRRRLSQNDNPFLPSSIRKIY